MKKVRILIVAACAGLLLLPGCQGDVEAEQEALIPVTAAPVVRGDVEISDRLTGLVRARNEVSVVTQFPARVEEVRVDPGQQVAQGDLLVVLDSADVRLQITQAEAGYNAARLQLEAARDHLEKTERLYREGAVSLQQYENARTQYEVQRDGSYDQARSARDLARRQLRETTITAPIAGTVGFVNVQAGQTPVPGSPLVTLLDLTVMEATFSLSEGQINQVAPGTAIGVQIEAAGGEPFAGTVTQVSPQADPSSRAFPIRVEIENPDGRIKSGMTASVYLVQQAVTGQLLVPEEAIRYTADGVHVYVLREDHAYFLEVEVVLADGTHAAVRGVLAEGDRVVLLGKERVSDGDRVQVVEQGGW